MKIEPSVSLTVNDVSMTPNQLEVILAVYETGSQMGAAQKMGISTPVLHRYIRQIEAKVGARLVETSPRGTVLNDDGEALAKEYVAMKLRMQRTDKVMVGCTIVTEDLVLSSLSALTTPEMYDLIISDDERNMRDFRARMMDLVVLDDPLYAYDTGGVEWEEVAEDRLLHVERSAAYGRYRYGAQRIGFRHIDTRGDQYRIERTEHSLSSLLRSNMSFFINESLAMKKGLTLKSATDPDLLRHKILAMYWEPRPEISVLVREMAKRTLNV